MSSAESVENDSASAKVQAEDSATSQAEESTEGASGESEEPGGSGYFSKWFQQVKA